MSNITNLITVFNINLAAKLYKCYKPDTQLTVSTEQMLTATVNIWRPISNKTMPMLTMFIQIYYGTHG